MSISHHSAEQSPSDQTDLAHGLRLAAIALASAAVTATLVIGVGNTLIDRKTATASAAASPAPQGFPSL